MLLRFLRCFNQPHPPLSYARVYLQGIRPSVPTYCPEKYAQLMKRCWASEPDERPDFAEVLDILFAMKKLNQPVFARRIRTFLVTYSKTCCRGVLPANHSVCDEEWVLPGRRRMSSIATGVAFSDDSCTTDLTNIVGATAAAAAGETAG